MIMDAFILTKNEQTTLGLLTGSGYSSYLVGGGMRDRLMGISPKDTDITTSALPEQVQAVFSNYKVVETGIKHGTVTVVMNGEPVEITTFRTDGSYSDNRHPDSVSFTPVLEEDLARRDFTINAMAYNPAQGLIDPFGGQRDIEKKIIRCVGQPDVRFTEDALRIMRAVRFAATLGFEIEEETKKAMERKKHLLKNISAERIYSELKRLLCGRYAASVLLKYDFVIFEVLPELAPMKGFNQHNPHHIYDVYTHTAGVVDACPAVAQLRLAALFHDAGKPACFSLDEKGVGHFKGHANISAQIAKDALLRLKSDSFTINRVELLIKHHSDLIKDDEKLVARWLRRMGAQALYELLALKEADNAAKNSVYDDNGRRQAVDEAKIILDKLIEEQAWIDLKQLAVNGNELMQMGVPSGKAVGDALELLLSLVVDKKLENSRAALTEYVKNHIIKGPD